MEIKSIPEIIKEMDYLVKEEKFDEAFQFAKENINLNKEYVEGEYIFKNLLEELLFQITIKKEIKRKYPLMLDYSTLYSNYGNVLLHFNLHFNEYENALKSFKLSYNYNPVNVKAIFGLCELHRIEKNWDEFYNLTIQSFKYDYYLVDLSKSFENLSIYYFNEYHISDDDENLKLSVYLSRLAQSYDGSNDSNENKTAIEFDDNALNEYDQSIEEIKDCLKLKGLPYGPSIEVITICKNLGFQLDEDKKVVPALFYFNIAYDLTGDLAIKDVIDDLEAKVERKLNE